MKVWDKFLSLLYQYIEECIIKGKPNSLLFKLEKGSVRIDIYRAEDTEAGKKLDKIINDALTSDVTVKRV